MTDQFGEGVSRPAVAWVYNLVFERDLPPLQAFFRPYWERIEADRSATESILGEILDNASFAGDETAVMACYFVLANMFSSVPLFHLRRLEATARVLEEFLELDRDLRRKHQEIASQIVMCVPALRDALVKLGTPIGDPLTVRLGVALLGVAEQTSGSNRGFAEDSFRDL